MTQAIDNMILRALRQDYHDALRRHYGDVWRVYASYLAPHADDRVERARRAYYAELDHNSGRVKP